MMIGGGNMPVTEEHGRALANTELLGFPLACSIDC
jgi:hypothetical protein